MRCGNGHGRSEEAERMKEDAKQRNRKEGRGKQDKGQGEATTTLCSDTPDAKGGVKKGGECF